MTNLQDLLAFAVSFVSIIFALIAGFIGLTRYKRALHISPRVAEEARGLSYINKTLPVHKNSIGAVSHAGEFSRADALADKVTELELEIRAFKELLFDDPKATLAVPLMMKDIEQLKLNIEKIDDSRKWYLGIIITIFLSLFAVAIAILLG